MTYDELVKAAEQIFPKCCVSLNPYGQAIIQTGEYFEEEYQKQTGIIPYTPKS
jgi:hypothetical protein